VYRQFFGITLKPFSIAPDPTFLYMSEGHREALAHLRYGLEGEGAFILLTGEVGAGKTTVCRCLLEQVPDDADIAYIINPKVTSRELLATICDELGIPRRGLNSAKSLVDAINTHLLAAHARGRRTILIIDEAQNLAPDVLEQIRLLTNLETNSRKLLQVILLGQPELRDKLARDDLRQLAQRVSARHHLGPLSRRDTFAYVRHRLAVAGLAADTFSDRAIAKLHALSGGIPRLINIIADRAMLGAYAKGTERITAALMRAAGREVLGDGGDGRITILPRRLIIGVTALVCAVILLLINHSIPIGITDKKAAAPARRTVDDAPTPDGTEGDKAATGTLIPWPAEPPSQTEEEALTALLSLWGIDTGGQRTDTWPCQYAEEAGLRCLFKKDGIGALLRLNRPAVLPMRDEKGGQYHVLITRVENGTGTFMAGGHAFQASLTELAARWDGNFTAIWKPPPGYRDSLRPGAAGAAVRWLAEQLALIDGEGYNTDEAGAYGPSLVNRVKRLQFLHGLPPDGIVGKDTITLINTLTHADVPRLTAATPRPAAVGR